MHPRYSAAEVRQRVNLRIGWPGPIVLLASVLAGLVLAFLPVTTAAALLAAAALVLVGLIQPLSLLFLSLIAGPFGALENVILGGPLLDSGQVLLLLALAAWIARGMVRGRLALPRSPLAFPLLLFSGIALLSLTRAGDLALGVKEVVKWLEITAVMLMVADLAPQLGRRTSGGDGQGASTLTGIWLTATMLLVAGLIQAAIGIWQFALRGEGPEHFLVLGRYYRAYGTFEQPNPFGGYMGVTALLACGILIGLVSHWFARRRRLPAPEPARAPEGKRFFVIVLAVAALATAMLMGLLFSWSRGAWVGFLAGLAAMILFWPRRLRHRIVGLLAALVLLAVVVQSGVLPPSVVERIGGFADDLTFGDVRGVDINDANYSVLERLAHWQAAIEMARERPWLGIGFGNYEEAYPRFALINWPDALGHAHNYYLNLLAEVGVAGLIAYVFLWSAVYWQTARVLKAADWPLRGVTLGLLGIWTALAVHHVVDKLYVNNLYVHLGVLFGLLQLLDLRSGSGLVRLEKAR